jgi:hypothetical protein
MREYYVFTLEALNDIGPSFQAKTTNVTLSETDSKSVPDVPQNVKKIKNENNDWTVSFDEPTNNGGYAITYYGAKYDDKMVTESSSPITVPNTDSEIKVFAQNKMGRSEEVEAVEEKPQGESKDKISKNSGTGPSKNSKSIIDLSFLQNTSSLNSFGIFLLIVIVFGLIGYFVYKRYFQLPTVMY